MMKLNKDKWERVKLGDVATIIGGGTPSRTNPDYFKGDILWIGPTEIPKDRIRVIEDTKEKISKIGLEKSSAKLLPKGTVLLTTRATVGEVAIAGKEIATSQSLENFICNNNKIDNWFLAFWLKANKTTIHSLSAGTTFKGITRNILAKIEILLPTLKEQNFITSLFQSIENAIEQVEIQENNLKILQKTLRDNLINKEPVFGNLLKRTNCEPTNFGNIANCIEEHDKEKKDVTRFVGLENIEPENLKISTWGNVADGTTFTKKFSKGDVLFGKRRSYLKKVAITDFDGICSSDILVFRAREKMILPGLLPYYVSSEAFIQHAVNTSAGSLSPRTKWKDLSVFEISIPEIKTQERILEIFQQLQTTISQLQNQKIRLKNLKQTLLNEILS
jgi:type I restriction enzyme S subunit